MRLRRRCSDRTHGGPGLRPGYRGRRQRCRWHRSRLHQVVGVEHDRYGECAWPRGRDCVSARADRLIPLQGDSVVSARCWTGERLEVRRADIVVAAVGVPGIVAPEMVKPGATVLDVGLTRTDEGIRGDVDPAVADVAGLLTPMPGGVGPMTIAMLLRSAIKAARYRRRILAYPML